MEKVIVIGGGIIGLSAAFYLQRAGCQVTVLDRGDFSDNCSYGNCGYVCPSHFIPLATPGIVRQGLKWMLNSRSPFYVEPRLSRSLIDWGWKFMRSATRANVDRAAIPLRDIALLSQQEVESCWIKLPGFDAAYEHKGLLEVFQTGKAADHAHHTVQKAHELGLDARLLDHQALQSMEPHTRIEALGAIFFKCDAHLYPNKLMKALIAHLRAEGVRLLSEAEVTGFSIERGRISQVRTRANAYEAGTVVLATGSWSRSLAALASVRLPLMPGRGYSVTLEDSPYRLNYPAILVEGRAAITPMDGNKIRFGGTMEIVPTDTPPRYGRVQGILDAVRRFYPEFDVPFPPKEKIWYGYRPCSADGLPYIGRTSKYRNLIVATGHSMLGLSLGAGTGRLICELVQERRPSVDLQPFAVERFG
ncbi:MAG: FAD-dependent oxidoreductase [Bacteroidota bacterium]|nr:FAD-dependent oxidoreductase [Bacteroidota bacterium]MDP4214555.1 FAD-dependent oxidoreductase [Bacteroidota bacterium]MDP4254859.1 FAD-dependent oxidoreductase [Bacteroidota bacterium]MDP4257858.1 FAD-dependent oxidoreductase [Bacteroidota bacterium]